MFQYYKEQRYEYNDNIVICITRNDVDEGRSFAI